MAGLYLHIPFCKQKCHYCDFHFSVSLRNKTALIQAIIKELELRKTEIIEPIETIYFGGGTPSLLEEKELFEIFEILYKNYQIIDNPEITLESNPDDLTLAKLKSFKNFPINRLSIGIQSFHNSELKMMNRVHSAEEALNSILNSQDIGFQNITIDLIYGMPHSSEQKWQYNLDTFLKLKIPHLSSYALTVEKKTALAHLIQIGKIGPIDEQLASDQFHTLRNFMISNGFEHYELSNFAKPNFYSRHNTSYWQNKSYIGFGPSAHSYNGMVRSWNISNNNTYIKNLVAGKLPKDEEILTTKDRYNEYIMTGLRTKWGVNILKIEHEFGIEYANYFRKKLNKKIETNLLQYLNEDVVGVKSEAFFLIDGIISDLFWV